MVIGITVLSMDFNIDKFWESIHPRIKWGYVSEGYIDVIRFGISNNHNNLRYEYRLTDWFSADLNTYPLIVDPIDITKAEGSMGDWLHRMETKISESGTTESLVLDMAKYWKNHLLRNGVQGVNHSYRFGHNHLLGKDSIDYYIRIAYDTYSSILNDDYPPRFKYQDICRGLWALTTGGYTSVVIQLCEFYKKLLLDPNSKLNKLYDGDSGGNRSIDNRFRVITSMSWPLIQCYKHIGDIESVKRCCRDIMSFAEYGKMWWYTATNRVLEAGIELYKIEPTIELHDWCYGIYHDISKMKIDNFQEAMDERLMISYMFYKHIIGKEIK